MNPELSVIISTYNRIDFLPKTVLSVLNQTFENFELIVCDDGSTDNTKEWITKLADPRIIYKYQKNTGEPSFPRNLGIKYSKGKFIAFLDSDDIWEPDKIEKQLKLFNNPCVGLVYSGKSLIDKNGLSLCLKKNINKYSGKVFRFLLANNFITCSSVILRRKLLFDNNLLFRGGRKSAEDWDLWLRLSMLTEFDYVDEPLVKYRVYPQSISKDYNLTYNSIMVVMRDIYYEICEKDPLFKKEYLTILKKHRRIQELGKAKELFIKKNYFNSLFNIILSEFNYYFDDFDS